MASRTRASGKDIVELFGYAPDDSSDVAVDARARRHCPFLNATCSKTNHDQSETYGTCAVTYGSKMSQNGEVIICPKRFYANGHAVLEQAARLVWPRMTAFIAGGSYRDLSQRARDEEAPVVAFGQGSGGEVGFSSGGSLSLDWVLQSYQRVGRRLEPVDFLCLEVQSIDITGNYRSNWSAYMQMPLRTSAPIIPNSQHGLNCANVHKRLIPQLIRKGNAVASAPRCRGLFFVLPDIVYQKFEEVVGEVEREASFDRENLTVMTFVLGDERPSGESRSLRPARTVHYRLAGIAEAFVSNKDPKVGQELDRTVARLIDCGDPGPLLMM